MGGSFGRMFGSAGSGSNASILNGLSISTSVFGQPVPLLYGTHKQTGNVIDYTDFTYQAQNSSSGGKGGGGGGYTSYIYQVAAAVGIGQGPIQAIGRVWGNETQQLLQYSPDTTLDAKTKNYLASLMFDSDGNALDEETDLTVFWGSLTQSPWGYMLTNHPDHALNYPLLAYVAGVLNLGNSNSLPNYSFEIVGNFVFGNGILDANPALVIEDVLINPVSGAGYPSAYLGDLTNYSSYCVANGLFLSPRLNTQKQGANLINDIMQCTNSQPVVSQGILYFIPYGTAAAAGNGATYTPNNEPIYSLSDDDFLYDGKNDPVQMTRDVENSDQYNFQQVSFSNRADEYASDVVTAIDQGGIDVNDVLMAPIVSLDDYITTPDVANIAAQNILQRIVYGKNKPTFTLPYYPYILLDPMDIVAITDTALGYDNTLVRIVSIDADDNKELTVTVEEVGINASDAVQYNTPVAVRASKNSGVSPGSVNAPVFTELPDAISSGLSLSIGVSGGNNWGGCNVYVSDDGNTYKMFGTINGPARQGAISAALPAGSDPDTSDILSVDVSMSDAELLSGTKNDADNYNTLFLVDNELMSYETATLTGPHAYNLSYLRRGAYGTAISAHNAGAQFLRIDNDRLFSYPFTQADIGKKLYFKFTSFNMFGSATQSLADVAVYTYTLQGSALISPLPAVQNMKISYNNNNAVLQWDPVTDFRSPIVYEIRKGSSFNAAQTLGRVNTPSFVLPGNDTYWIAAAYQATYNGSTAYIYSPWQEVTANEVSVPANIVTSFDEAATGWTGTLSGGAYIESGNLMLIGASNFSTIPDVGQANSIQFYGGVSPYGTYQIPSGHVSQLSSAQIATISCLYSCEVVPALDKFSQVQSVAALADFAGNNPQFGSCQIQINVMDGSGNWSGWKNFIPGKYYGKAFNLQLVLSSTNSQYTVIVSDFSFSVSLDDNVQNGNITIPAAGASVIYPQIYNSSPTPVVSIFNAQSGDTIVLTNQTSSGFTVQITNGGVGVSRSINWVATGY